MKSNTIRAQVGSLNKPFPLGSFLPSWRLSHDSHQQRSSRPNAAAAALLFSLSSTETRRERSTVETSRPVALAQAGDDRLNSSIRVFSFVLSTPRPSPPPAAGGRSEKCQCQDSRLAPGAFASRKQLLQMVCSLCHPPLPRRN